MADGSITNSLLTESFFRNYAKELVQRAETAGLVSHNATSGSVKEFLCRAVFAQTLPDACSLVSGQVFDGRGNVSRQCDVIVFDKRVPKLEVANGIGMFPIEGVIASIEVKSHLNKTDIETALENSLALQQLNPMHCGTIQVATKDGVRQPANDEELRSALTQMAPGCYVFSFDSCGKETAAEHVNNWCLSKESPAYARVGFAKLPRCIVGKQWIGLLDDGYITISNRSIRRDGKRNAMVFFDTEEPFTIFLGHLLHKVSLRIRALIGASDAYFTFNHLLPTERLLEKLLRDGNPKYIEWD